MFLLVYSQCSLGLFSNTNLQTLAIDAVNNPAVLPAGTPLKVASGARNFNDNTSTKSCRLTLLSVSVELSQFRDN